MHKLSSRLLLGAGALAMAACGAGLDGNGHSADARSASFTYTALGTKVPEQLTEVGGVLYFQADVQREDTSRDYEEIWQTDGTVEGTTPATDIQQSHLLKPDELTAFGGHLYFSYAYSSGGRDLMVLDPTEDKGARHVDGNTAYRNDPRNLTVFNGKLYFSAVGDGHGRELWVTDGTAAGTRVVKVINQQTNDSGQSQDAAPRNLTPAGSVMYFTAEDGVHGRELWVTDGTEAGTRMVRNINPDGGSTPNHLTMLGDQVIFNANDGEHPYELWISDGTEAGTRMLKQIHTQQVDGHPAPGSYPQRFIEFNDRLYFVAATNGFTNGNELWVTDGTTEGTQRISTVVPGNDFAVYNGHLYFGGAGDEYQGELWRTDGTAEGTERVTALNPDDSIQARYLSVYGNLLFFVADDGQAEEKNRQLWITDGTAAGTLAVQPAGATEQDPLNPDFVEFELKVFDGALYFAAAFNEDGRQLWRMERVD